MDLGYTDSSPLSSIAQAGQSSEPKKPVYPDFSIRGQPAKDQLSANECEPGEVYTATVRLKATSVTKNEKDDPYGGTSIRYEVLSMDDFKHAGDEESEDAEDAEDTEGGESAPAEDKTETKEEDVLGYKRPKGPAKETPDMSAKTLY